MATVNVTDYAANDIIQARLLTNLKLIAGKCTDGDVIKHPLTKVIAAVATSNTAVAAGSQLQVDTSTDGQITVTDPGNSGDTISFVILGW